MGRGPLDVQTTNGHLMWIAQCVGSLSEEKGTVMEPDALQGAAHFSCNSWCVILRICNVLETHFPVKGDYQNTMV